MHFHTQTNTPKKQAGRSTEDAEWQEGSSESCEEDDSDNDGRKQQPRGAKKGKGGKRKEQRDNSDEEPDPGVKNGKDGKRKEQPQGAKKGVGGKRKEQRDSSDEEPDSGAEEGLCEYERRRLDNIRENMALMAQLNIFKAKEDLSTSRKRNKRSKQKEKEPISLEPSRRSLRQQLKLQQQLMPNSDPPLPVPMEPTRKPSGSIEMECVNYVSREVEEFFRGEIVGLATRSPQPEDSTEGPLNTLEKPSVTDR